MSMRDIKFRAWDKGHNKMSYKVNLYSLNQTGKIDNIQIDSKHIVNHIGLDCEVMQYTGLKDKNGKEIYEGDIVRTSILYPSDPIDLGGYNLYDVYFKNGCFAIDKEPLFDFMDEVEIIGNIYETPELLPGYAQAMQ